MLTLPFILLYRGTVACLPSCTSTPTQSPLDVQLSSNRHQHGGWYTNHDCTLMLIRETFYTLMALKFCKRDVEYVAEYVLYLAKQMSAAGQIPWKRTESWSGQVDWHYIQHNNPVVDATAQFIIMVGWLYEFKPNIVDQLYLHTRRAHAWLQTFMQEYKFYEPLGSSWETTRLYDNGYGLTTNVLICQSIRAMELICMVQKEQTQQKRMQVLHTRVKATLQEQLFTTQEVLPRMLGVYWNIVPEQFWRSFNQELKYPIPLLTSGPLSYPTTWDSWMYGRDDLHTTLIYPWLGFFWISLLAARSQHDAAVTWWELYSDFHTTSTLYDIYSPELSPVQRAFLHSQRGHSLTLAMYQAASHGLVSQKYLPHQAV